MLGRKTVSHPTAPNFYQYKYGENFTPGAAGFVFQPKYSLPPVLAQGAGTIAGQRRILPAPPIFVNQTTQMVGLGGIQAGQFASQGLIDSSGA